MSGSQRERMSLPDSRNRGFMYIVSIATALFMAGTYASGLFMRSAFYPTEELIRTCVPNDAANLIIGLPALIASMILTRRGSLLGLMCWPGALLFVVYNEIAYLFMLPLHGGYLAHLALAALAAYGAAGLLRSSDGQPIRDTLEGAVPARLAGGILAAMGALFFIRTVAALFGGVLNAGTVSQPDFAVLLADFFFSPAWIIGGILLWRRSSEGYILGPGLLFQASLLFIALIVFLILQPVLTDAPAAVGDIIVILVMGLVCIVPFVLLARGIIRASGRPK